MPPRALVFAALAASLTCARAACAEQPSPAPVVEPGARPTLLWAAAQLIPSPQVMIDGHGATMGMRWQVTPLLYSFGINRRLSPWRVFVATPPVRYAGSIELYASPEYIAAPGGAAQKWLFRAGLRSYYPLLHRGEYLSLSLGGSALYFRERPGMAFEAGVHALFGFFGLYITHCPTPALRSTTLALDIRYL